MLRHKTQQKTQKKKKVNAGAGECHESQGPPLHGETWKSIYFLIPHTVISAPVIEIMKYWLGRKGCSERRNVPWPFYSAAERWIKHLCIGSGLMRH